MKPSKFKLPKKYKPVGTNKFSYDPTTDTYTGKHTLKPVYAYGKDRTIQSNVNAAINKFGAGPMYRSALIGAGLFGGMANLPIAYTAGFLGQGLATDVDLAAAYGTFNPLVRIMGANSKDKPLRKFGYSLWNPRSYRALQRRKSKKTQPFVNKK